MTSIFPVFLNEYYESEYGAELESGYKDRGVGFEGGSFRGGIMGLGEGTGGAGSWGGRGVEGDLVGGGGVRGVWGEGEGEGGSGVESFFKGYFRSVLFSLFGLL